MKTDAAHAKDKHGFAYAIFFFQGIGQLFPWNAFLTASNYFSQRFCSTTFENDFENYLLNGFTVSSMIGLCLTIKFGTNYSYHEKIVCPLGVYTFLFALTAMLVLWVTMDKAALFWITLASCLGCGLAGSILSAGFFGLSSLFPASYTGAMMSGQGFAGLSVSLTSMLTQAAGPIPDGYCPDTTAAVANPAASNSNSTTNASVCVNYEQVSYSAFTYFVIATAVLMACVGLFFTLMRLPYTVQLLPPPESDLFDGDAAADNDDASNNPLLSIGSHNVAPTVDRGGGEDGDGAESGEWEEEEEEGGGKGSGVDASAALHAPLLLPADHTGKRNGAGKQRAGPGQGQGQGERDSGFLWEFDEAGGALGRGGGGASKTRAPVGITSAGERGGGGGGRGSTSTLSSAAPAPSAAYIRQVFSVIKSPALGVFGVFFVSLAVFPCIFVVLRSAEHCAAGSSRAENDLFVPLLFVIVALGDFSGRLIAGNCRAVLTAKNVHWAAVVRVVFFPMYLLCNVVESKLPVLFRRDAWPILFSVLFGLSGGYVSSSCMIMGPRLVPPRDAAMAGNIMVFALTLGLLVGSALSFVVTYVSQGHW